jgi:hypothetical protein
MLFFPIQQELGCISERGVIVGKIIFDDTRGKHIFYQSDAVELLRLIKWLSTSVCQVWTLGCMASRCRTMTEVNGSGWSCLYRF